VSKRDKPRPIRPRYAKVDKMQMTAPAAASRFTASAVRRIAAPITHRRDRRPLSLPLAFNLVAVALVALAIALAVARF